MAEVIHLRPEVTGALEGSPAACAELAAEGLALASRLDAFAGRLSVLLDAAEPIVAALAASDPDLGRMDLTEGLTATWERVKRVTGLREPLDVRWFLLDLLSPPGLAPVGLTESEKAELRLKFASALEVRS